MDRPTITMIPANTPWLTDPSVRAVCQAIAAQGAPIYMVGGCVRDAILGVAGSDVDMATPVLPQEVSRLAQAAGLKVVPTGIDHGTVTVIAGGTGFEITSFRKDIATDGRRAVVAFSDDITEDARRRDFTLNALYATLAGDIVDPLGGLPDCHARRIRFIEDAETRIREDYLRILRFFRFHARYADPAQGFDPDALAAIASNSAGLETLSAERVGQELCRLLAAPDPMPAVAVMHQIGVLPQILPGSDVTFLGPVVHLADHLCLPPDWRLRLAALGGEDLQDRLRLTNKDAKAVAQMREMLGAMTPDHEIAYRHGFDRAVQVAILRGAMANQPMGKDMLQPLQHAAQARLPLTAQDLMPGLSGKALGDRLATLENRWIASGFTLTRDALLASD
ncbi:CCA tRNA nucleotidyltransferase [Roseobacter sp.]|uniref:CCA tRNA nucleotidyltransferase n=1 Tax=Roseobacter sp. TaxID=1907202 RepID=UPI00329A1052